MTRKIPQHILDGLTDVAMPRLPAEPRASERATVADLVIPVYRSACLVVGSGAAGLRAAVELKRRGVDVTVATQSAWGGTSACSGSDKQTLHTANTADQGDNYRSMADAIRAGGAMNEDIAYIEAVGSARMMASLQYLGLPLPQDRFGGTLRYQTDHDEVGRATSCGPRTSRLMVKVLAEEAIRLGVPVFNHTIAVRILTEGTGKSRRAVGVLAMRGKDRSDANPLGLAAFSCSALVLAAGGPGELYRDSVYPKGCFGSLGLAAEAGMELVNLTESQFGIGTRREGFPWNLSGTYVQAIPHIYSLDQAGREHHFLAGYYRTTQELASNIFRKGYQWPFHATRMLDFGSSLVDLAIWRETQAGRRVFMDFNRNPLAVPGDQPFSFDRLDDDVRNYLGQAGATGSLPIDRLRHMNPLAIELYRRYKIDITKNPLEFAVNNQHMNGGIAVDTWGRSSLAGCYAIGEAAGTHGVTRPGGAALNAGQVFGTRAAEHIAASEAARPEAAAAVHAAIGPAIQSALGILNATSALTVRSVRSEVQSRMSDSAGMICSADGIETALADAQALNRRIGDEGISVDRPAEAARAIQWRQLALASEAVLAALAHYVSGGGGSRGARAILDSAGAVAPVGPQGPIEELRFREEHVAQRDEQIVVQMTDGKFEVSTRQLPKREEDSRPFFERDWPDWLTGAVFDLDRTQRRQ
ncbi:MAG: FAD-binding protein [Hyphomicrobiaceae bacterium]|nr:FAD-binding protein [Hyphomicrobiaceae bacterium]